MKKLLLISLLICLPCFASEQSVLQDARTLFNAQFRTVDTSKATQDQKDLLGLVLLSQRHATVFKTDELVDIGNVILKKVNAYSDVSMKNQAFYMAYMCKAMGYMFNYQFTEASEALNQMDKYKNCTADGVDKYNHLKKLYGLLEQSYNKYKSMGYDMNSQSTQTMIKRQLGL